MSNADAHRWLDLLLQANLLKTTPRTGWHLRGVPQPESVADHTFATATVALVLAELSDLPVAREKVLMMALLHDLPESVISDIPRRGAHLLPPGAKESAEMRALTEILSGLPVAAPWGELVAEYQRGETPEARLVHDADQLEFLLQAFVYRQSTGTRRLEDLRAAFEGRALATPAAERLRDELLARWS